MLLFVSHETNPCGHPYDVYLDPVSDLRYSRYFAFEAILNSVSDPRWNQNDIQNQFWVGLRNQNDLRKRFRDDFVSQKRYQKDLQSRFWVGFGDFRTQNEARMTSKSDFV